MLVFIKVFLSALGEFSRASLWTENLLFHAGGTITVVCELHTHMVTSLLKQEVKI